MSEINFFSSVYLGGRVEDIWCLTEWSSEHEEKPENVSQAWERRNVVRRSLTKNY